MSEFHVALVDPTEPDSSGESDSERKSGQNELKPSPDILRISAVLRTASELDWKVRHLILIRGLPGSGKTTLAKALINQVAKHVIVSETEYEEEQQARQQQTALPIWRSRLIEEARAACKQKAWAAMKSGVLAVIVDNDNLRAEDMEPYVVEAVKRDYTLHLLEPNTPWRYKPNKLIKLTRRPVTLEQIQQMNQSFDRTLRLDDLIRGAKMKLKPFASTSFALPLNYHHGGPSYPCPAPMKNESLVDSTPMTGILAENDKGDPGKANDNPSVENDGPSSSFNRIPETAASECFPSTSCTEMDPSSYLASVFPHLSRTQIREFLDLTAGDHIWASELILEGVQIGSDVNNEPEDDVRQITSINETTQVPKVGTNRYVEATVPHEAEASQMQSNMSVNHTLPHVPFAVDSPTIASASSRSFSITRQFVQDAQELYGFALGIPPVDLSTAAVPDFLFDEWSPEPELVRGILQSFLRFLGVAKTPASSGFRSKLNPACRSSKPNRNNALSSCSDVTESVSFTDIMADDEAIHRSVQDFRSSLDSPVVRRILDRLMKKFPSVQRATMEETFVRMDFNELETELSLRLLFSSIPNGPMNNTGTMDSSDGSSTQVRVNYGQPMEPNLSLQEIQEEEEAIHRSVEDQRDKLKSLANQLSLCRLKSQFPDIQLIELENLFIRFDLNEPETVKHLLDRGFLCQSVAPLISGNEDASQTRNTQSVRPLQPTEDLNLLNAKLSLVRQRICHIRQRMLTGSEKGVGSYYSSELSRLYREQRELSLTRAQRMVDSRSIDYEKELIANGENPSSAASKAFAYIDLHGLDKSCALTVLKERIHLLESVLQQSRFSTSTSANVIVITGRGGHCAEWDLVQTAPILRPAVMSYLNANRYSFNEKYCTGSGYFMVTISGPK